MLEIFGKNEKLEKGSERFQRNNQLILTRQIFLFSFSYSIGFNFSICYLLSSHNHIFLFNKIFRNNIKMSYKNYGRTIEAIHNTIFKL